MSIVVTLSFIGSLVAIWVYSNLVQESLCPDVRLLLASATFLSLVALVFNVFWMVGLEWESVIMVLVSILFASTAFLARKRQHKEGSIPRDLTQNLRECPKLSLLIVFVASFLLYVYPSLPSLLPLGWNVDGGNRLAITNIVLRALGNSTNPQSMVANSLGFDVNLGFMARALGTPVELTIYPFSCLLVALLVCCCCSFVRRVVPSSRLCAGIACFVFATSAPMVNLVAIDVSWADLLALFLISTSVLILTENRSSLISRTFAITPIILGITFVYALFGGFISIFVCLLILWSRPRLKQAIMSLGITFAATGLSYLLFINGTVWRGAVSGMRYIVLPNVTRFYYLDWLGIIPVFLSIVAIGRPSLKEHPGPILFVLSIGAQAVTFIGLASVLVPGTYFPYFMLKMSYLLPLPLSVLSGLGFKKLMSLHLRLNSMYPSFPTKRRFLRFTVLVMMILVMTVSVGEGYIHLTHPRPDLNGGLLSNPPIPISPEQYQLAIWVEHNLHQPITLSGGPPSTLYFWGIISGKWYETSLDNKYAESDWWIRPAVTFDRWNKSSVDGDVIVSLHSEDFWDFYFSHRQATTVVLNYSTAHVRTNATGVFLEWDVSPDMVSYRAESATLTAPMFQVNLNGLMPQTLELTDNTGVRTTFIQHGFSNNALTFIPELKGSDDMINATALVKVTIMASLSEKVAGANRVTALRILSPRKLFGYTVLFENEETIVVEKTSKERVNMTDPPRLSVSSFQSLMLGVELRKSWLPALGRFPRTDAEPDPPFALGVNCRQME
jgi:hypothetical protein